jgi:hypothetical protein
LKAWKRVPGRPRIGRVKISDNWFSKDGIDGVGTNYSSFVPSYRIAKYLICSIIYGRSPNLLQGLIRMQNLRFAYFLNGDSLISCAPHKK